MEKAPSGEGETMPHCAAPEVIPRTRAAHCRLLSRAPATKLLRTVDAVPAPHLRGCTGRGIFKGDALSSP